MLRLLRLLAPWCGATLAALAAERPNFVVIFADDLGYGDVGFNGATTIATPRLDRLAREGTRFTAAYAAAPFCSPSRAALLTGRLPARAGVPYVLFPAENHGLPRAELTLAEVLRTTGYATACIGKWHLGWAPEFRPMRHGFDVFYGTPYSNDSNEWPVGQPFIQVMGLEPFPLVDGDTVIEAPVEQATLTQRYTERAVRFIRENRERPFFLYLPHTMPHIPQHASPRFAGRSRGGLYGDAIEELDWSTGVILDTLRELGLDERTIVVFTSDNGASIRPGSGPAAVARSAVKTGKKGKAAVAPVAPKTDRFPGRSFGGSNGPLRAGKGTTWEGGVRVPFALRWPGTVTAGREVADAVSLLDLFPTFAALAGAALPADRTYDGHDLWPVLRGGREPAPRTVYHYFGYQPQAIREGRWKLFVRTDRRPEPVPDSLWFVHQPRLFENQHRLLAEPLLYDLEADSGEMRDVAAQHPEVVRRLTERMAAFDAALQRDRRPMEFVLGPTPPEPQTVRTPETDLSIYRRR
jgi:arylsulfatase A